jgi:hypothetical protein
MTKSRRLEDMRKAFDKRDVQASALMHAPERIAQAAKEQQVERATFILVTWSMAGWTESLLHLL